MVNGTVATITATQCRMARAALDWSQLELARRSGVGSTSVKKFELGAEMRLRTVAALRRSMEAAGVVFIDEGAKVKGRRASFGAFLASDGPAPERLDDGQGDATPGEEGLPPAKT